MRKISWFLVGLLYFVLVWLNRVDTSNLIPSPIVKELGSAFVLIAWSLILGAACHLTWLPSEAVLAPKLKRLATAGLGSLLIQYLLGALSRNYQAGLSCPEFPKCSDSFLPFSFESSIAFAHRWWGILMLGLFFHLAVAAIKSAPALLAPAKRASGFSLAQVFLGIGVVMTQLHPDSRLMHVAIGYALWGHLFFILIRTGGFRPTLSPQN